MIATITHTMHAPGLQLPRMTREDARDLALLREEAAQEAERLFGGVSGKRINAALVPGVTRHSISRAIHGCDGNPFYKLPSWFVLCRRLGIPKEWPQRALDWLQRKLDEAYGDVPDAPLAEVLDRDAQLDGQDDLPRIRAVRGDKAAILELLDIEEQQLAHGRTVLARLRAEVAYL